MKGLWFSALGLVICSVAACSSDGKPPAGEDSASRGDAARGGSTGVSGSVSQGGSTQNTGGMAGVNSGGASSNTAGTAGTSTAGANSGGQNNTAGMPPPGGTPAGGGGGVTEAGGGGMAGEAVGGAGANGATGCDNPALILCEDFDSTDEGAIPSGWTQTGDASVASDQAHSGMHSLKIEAAENGPRRISHSAQAFGAAHFGRVYYRVQLPVPTVFVHSTIVALQGDGPNIGPAEYRVVDTVKNESGMHQFLYNVQPNGAEFAKGSSYDWQFEGEWHCAEWQIDGENQSYHFFFDGEEVTQIAIDNGPGNYGDGENRSEMPLSFEEIRVGWYNYQSAPPGFVAWVDDLAISTERIGCD